MLDYVQGRNILPKVVNAEIRMKKDSVTVFGLKANHHFKIGVEEVQSKFLESARIVWLCRLFHTEA